MTSSLLVPIAVCCALTHASDARAQDTTSSGGTIVLFAAVSAKEVRFTKQPTIKVTLVNGSVDSVRVVERRNLPDPVQPGTTYRDVYIAVEVIGRLNADCLAGKITRQAVPACGTARDTTLKRSP